MDQEERVRSLREVLTSGLSGGEGSPSALSGSMAGEEYDLPQISPRMVLDRLLQGVPDEVLNGPIPEMTPEMMDKVYETAASAGFAGGMLKMHGIGKALVLSSKYGGPDRVSLFKEGLLVPEKDWRNVKNLVRTEKAAHWAGPDLNRLNIGTEQGRKGILAHEFTHERFSYPSDAMEAAVVNRLMPTSDKIFDAKTAGKLEGGFSRMDYWNLSPEEQTAMIMARKMVFAIENNRPFNFDRAFMESAREGQTKALNFMENYVAGTLGGKMPEPNYGVVSEALREYKKILGVKDRNVSYSVGKGETP